MRSTFSGLNTVVRGIYGQQLSLNTVGHNIANANTEGYSRQRVNLTTSRPEVVYGGSGALQVGTGVTIQSVTRARDVFADRQYWKESSGLGYGIGAQSTLSQVEDIFHDDADTGIQTILNNFWQSWQTLATNASNDSARTAVRERGAELVQAITHAGDELKDLVANINDTLEIKVTTVNNITAEIASLNKQIANIEVGGRDNANDLRDRRDFLVDKLSTLMNVRVFEDANHNYIVQGGDIVLADGQGNTALALNDLSTAMDPDYGIELRYIVAADNKMPIKFTNGELAALQEANTTVAKGYLDQLSTMSQYLLQEFNAVHRAGFGSDNTTGNNFFGDPSVNYATATYSKGGWLDALSINRDLYNTGGIAKIAAKTLVSNPVEQSNATGGQGTVGGTYTGTGYTAMSVRITGVAAGAATGVEYSTDGGITWTAGTGAGPFNLTLGLTITIAADADNAVGDTYTFSVPQGNASGDNATLLGNALKNPTAAASVLAGSSLDEYYGSLVGRLGIESQSAARLAENQQILVDQITTWRLATAGVNIDEEMTDMIRFQKGYNAAARILTSIDEMLDKLINGTGVVGR
jgi:flagellar hook-associated protein 1 FlgK